MLLHKYTAHDKAHVKKKKNVPLNCKPNLSLSLKEAQI